LTATSTKRNYLRIAKLAIVCSLTTSYSGNAAVILEHSGTVRAGTAYHSNLQFLDSSVEESTYVYSLVPEYKLSALDDKNKWFGSLGVNFQRASNQNILGNREDPFATLGWERLFESGKLDLLADYTRQTSRITQFNTTGAVLQDGTSVVKNYSASWDYYLSQKLTLNTNAHYQDNIFTGVLGLGNFNVRDYGIALKYAYSESIMPYLSALASDFKADGVPDNFETRYQTYRAGVEVNLTPQFSYIADLGFVQFNSTSNDEIVGKLTASYLGERYDLTGTLERSVFPTGLGFIDVAESLTSAFKYNLTPRSSWGVNLGLRENKSGVDTQELIGFYDYEITSAWLMHVEASQRNLKFTGQNSVDDTSLGVFFTYTSPKF
jgi:hypothetical protein